MFGVDPSDLSVALDAMTGSFGLSQGYLSTGLGRDATTLDALRAGPVSGQPSGEWGFTRGTDERKRRAALGHQTRVTVGADQALAVVRMAWAVRRGGNHPGMTGCCRGARGAG